MKNVTNMILGDVFVAWVNINHSIYMYSSDPIHRTDRDIFKPMLLTFIEIRDERIISVEHSFINSFENNLYTVINHLTLS